MAGEVSCPSIYAAIINYLGFLLANKINFFRNRDAPSGGQCNWKKSHKQDLRAIILIEFRIYVWVEL